MYLTGCHRSRLERADIPNVPCAVSVGRHDLCMTKVVGRVLSLAGEASRAYNRRRKLRVPVTSEHYSLLFRFGTTTWQ